MLSSSGSLGKGKSALYLLQTGKLIISCSLGDVINTFRDTLDLEEVPMGVGPVLAAALEIPFTYCWSPALVPKPTDWPPYIDVCGFFFREPQAYTPTADIDEFLCAGTRPVYIGFGSIVIDNPDKMTALILEAVRTLGIRAIISRGWSNLGDSLSDVSKDVLFIDDCPHEWLFQHVAAVVHHGGAGTAACGLKNACPTVIIPFFGDQPFWGSMVAAAGAGPDPIPHKLLTCQNLAESISFCLTKDAMVCAHSLSAQMDSERGVDAAVQSFHANLPLEAMQCALVPYTTASWVYKKASVRLSKLAAQILIDNDVIDSSDLESYETQTVRIQNDRWDPLTGTGAAGFGMVGGMGSAAKNMLIDPAKELKRDNSESSKMHGPIVAGRMAGGFAKGFGKFNMALFKGAIVDIPLATAEGFRNVPRLYGEEIRDNGQVTGVVSGFQVGARNFAHGMVDGFSDPFKQTYETGKKEGAIGYVKGFGKGMAGFLTKTSSAAVGMVAYPGDGISKSLRSLSHGGTKKRIKMYKLVETEWLAAEWEKDVDVMAILRNFETLRRGKEKA